MTTAPSVGMATSQGLKSMAKTRQVHGGIHDADAPHGGARPGRFCS